MLGDPGTVGIGEHSHHQVVAFAGSCDIAVGRAHGAGAALDEGAPGEIIAAPLKSLSKAVAGAPKLDEMPRRSTGRPVRPRVVFSA